MTLNKTLPSPFLSPSRLSSCPSRVFCSTATTRLPPSTWQSCLLTASRLWTTLQSVSWSCGWRPARWRRGSTAERRTAGAGGRCGLTWCHHPSIVTPLLCWAGPAPEYETQHRHNNRQQQLEGKVRRQTWILLMKQCMYPLSSRASAVWTDK